MATNNVNFVGAHQGTQEPRLKNRQKPMIFAVSGPGLTNGAADCSGSCGAFWLKFYVVGGLEYGNK